MASDHPPKQTPILIAGAGPVGLTLAIALAKFGVDCVVVERNTDTTRHPKMDITNGRSMEIFRRLGIADKIIEAGVAPNICLDVAWITGFVGHEIHRFKYASPNEARARYRALNDGSHATEPGIRISQIVVEPLLRDIAAASPHITLCYGWAFERLKQQANNIAVTVSNGGSGDEKEITCAYLAGCDGGNSKVREALGIGLSGRAAIRRRYSVHFHSRDKNILEPWGPAWHYQSPVHGTLISQDGQNNFTLHSALGLDEDENTIDPYDVVRRFVGRDLDFKLLLASGWDNNLLVAEKYGERRVFLAGDSAHQYIPTGGYGMNTGIGDAYTLSWMLAALIQGWGGPGLLAAYGRERLPVGLRNREASGRHADLRLKISEIWEDGLEGSGSNSAEARTRVGGEIAKLGNAENESFGIEFGYGYPGSPLILGCNEASPREDPLIYHPTTVPGYRVPSLYLEIGEPIYDHFGTGFTLLNFQPERINTAAFDASAKILGLPLKILPLSDSYAREIYDCDLVLLRPDDHACWRGDSLPEDITSILTRVTGRASQGR